MAAFRVNTTTAGSQIQTDITKLSDGGFAITWTSQDSDTGDVYMQRYDANGSAVGGETRINTNTSGVQIAPAGLGLNNGGIFVTWDDSNYGIAGKVFESDGDVLVSDFQVGLGDTPDSIQLANGNIVVTSHHFDGSGPGIYAQILDEEGIAIGSEFLVNSTTASNQLRSCVALLDNGGFVVTWESYLQDGSDYGAYGRVFDEDGDPLTAEFQINNYTNTAQNYTSVTGLNNGTFVVTWHSNGQDGNNYGVYAQIYANNGTEIGGEFLVNTTTTGAQQVPNVVALDYGNFMISWEGVSTSEYIYGKIFDDKGNAISSEFLLNNTVGLAEPKAVHLGDGAMAVTWTNTSGDASGAAIYADLINAATKVNNLTLTGTSGADTLIGSYGNDTITGSDGNDTIYGTIGSDSMNGGNNTDTLSYIHSSSGVNVNIGSNTASGGAAQGDSISNFENLVGSNYNDTLTGSSGANSISGLNGDDLIEGGAGADTLDGGADIDTLSYAGSSAGIAVDIGANTASGGDAAGDVISNFENLTGSAQNDTLTGSSAANIILGGNGNDIIEGGAGNDTLDGGAGNDAVSYANSSAAVSVNLATNVVSGGDAAGDAISNFESVTGSAYDDTLTGNSVANAINGGVGNDLLVGGAGADTINGGADNDTLSYAASSAAVNVSLLSGTGLGGDAAGDVISNIENVIGSDYNDYITGSAGDNILTGGLGNDTIESGLGADTIDGGAGNDFLTYTSSNAAVSVNLTTGAASGGHAAGDVFTGIEEVQGSNYADLLIGNASANRIIGGTGDDTIEGGAGADTLSGSGGNDLVTYANSNAAVTINLNGNTASGGHAAGDVISGFEHVIGSDYNDTLLGNSLANSISGGLGNDTIQGLAGADTLDGGAGNDTLSYASSASGVSVNLATNAVSGGDAAGDVISGFEHILASLYNDTLMGDSGNNTIDGRNGDDIIEGGAGADTLDGNLAIDTLSYANSSAAVSVNLTTNAVSGGDATGDTVSNFENILGSAYDDTLTGSAVANTITGGAGVDVLTGNGGADTYGFTAITDSGIGSGNRDVIADFSQADADVIDLSAIAGGLLVFVGNTAFSGTANEVRYAIDTLNNLTVVEIDSDGDTVVDAEIELAGQVTLVGGDFVL